VQCLRTYDMETANIITINTDDKNLAEVIKKIIAEAGLTVADLFDDDEVRDHIHESGIPADEIYDEDDILDCGCVTDKIQELEDQIAELEEKNDELDTKNAKLKRKNAELERQLAEFREWNAKMKDNENEEWCRRCGSWQNCERDGSDIIKDAKWGYVCHDCLHHLDNPDHERCKECDCCKDCDCCECGEESDAETEMDEDQDNFTNRVCGYYPECGEGFHLSDPHYYDEEEGQCYCSEECFKKEQNRFAKQDRCEDKEKTEE